METRWWPWMDALRSHAGRLQRSPINVVVETNTKSVVWIEWHWRNASEQDAETWRLMFEALELLSILAHSNQEAWRKLVECVWPSTSALWARAPPSQVFTLGCDVVVATPRILNPSSERFLPDYSHSEVSGAYETVRNELEDEMSAKSTIEVTPSVDIRIVVDHLPLPGRIPTLTTLLAEVVQVVGLQYAQEHVPLPCTSAARWKPLFRIQEVKLTGFVSHNSPKDFLYLQRIAACDVHVDNLQLSNLELTEATALQFTTMLQLFISSNASGSFNNSAPVKSIEVREDATVQTSDGIFSALFQSKSVRDFYCEVPEADLMLGAPTSTQARDRWWQWIAATVFSSRATNLIEYIHFSESTFSLHEVRVLDQALQSADPLLTLYPGYVREEDVTVIASKFRLRGSNESFSSFTLPVPVECISFGHDKECDEWLVVLLPGWGLAWVRQSDAIIQTSTPVSNRAHAERVRPFKRIRIDYADLEDVVELLRVVGRALQQLEISNMSPVQPAAEWFTRVFAACPQLEVLSTSYFQIPSLHVFTRAYEAGACCQTRLMFHNVRIDDFQSSASRFFNCLALPGHPLAKYLRELQISVSAETVPTAVIESIAKMLNSNHSLCELMVEFQSVEPPILQMAEKTLVEDIQRHNGETVGIRLGPLALDSKAAFMSVIGGRSMAIPQALQSMDAAIVGLIFQFAATCKKREVQVAMFSLNT